MAAFSQLPATPGGAPPGVAGSWETVGRETYAVRAAKEIAVSAAELHRVPAAPGAEHGAEWGTVIHFLLETALREPGRDLGDLARSALEEQGLDPALAATALATVAAVQASVETGLEFGKDAIIDHFVIPNISMEVINAIAGTVGDFRGGAALGVIETFSAATCVVAADAASKAAEVDVLDVRLAMGLGGKAFCLLSGDVGAVKMGIEAGAAGAAPPQPPNPITSSTCGRITYTIC